MTKFYLYPGERPTTPEARPTEREDGIHILCAGDSIRVKDEVVIFQKIEYESDGSLAVVIERVPTVAALKQFWSNLFGKRKE